MARQLERFGIDAILVTDPDATGERLLSAFAHLPGIVEAVAGACSVLLRFDDWPAARSARSTLKETPVPAHLDSIGPIIEIPVHYGGVDLAQIADECGLSPEGVINRHRSAVYAVAFCGFTPGFAYLAGLPCELRVPRLPSPRNAVPAGSVAIADSYCGIYPRATPGGWRIIGHTDMVLFDVHRDPPALLTPGMRVRFTLRQA